MLNSNKKTEIAKGYTPRQSFENEILKTLTTNAGKINSVGIIEN